MSLGILWDLLRVQLAQILLWSTVLGAAGCASVVVETRLGDGNWFQVQGQGAEAQAEVKCIRPSAIKVLTGSEIPDNAPPASCYTTVIVSSKSSAISKAISAYVGAEADLLQHVRLPRLGIDSGGQPAESGYHPIDADSVVAAVIIQALDGDRPSFEALQGQLRPSQVDSIITSLRTVAEEFSRRGQTTLYVSLRKAAEAAEQELR